MKRAALYVRVSTEEQANEGHSIPAQLKELHNYACANDLEVVAEYADEGKSGRTAERQQFQEMITAAKKKPRSFDVILIHKSDRFARNRDDAVIFKKLLKGCGIELISVTERFDDSPSGRLLEGMMEVLADFYSDNLAHEVLKGQRQRASEGKGMCLPPIGYTRNSEGKYEPDLETAPIVQWLFHRYAAGEDGLRSLAHFLRDQGAAQFGAAVSRFSWTEAYVRRILKNEAYQGTLIWGIRDTRHNRQIREEADWVVVKNAHEPLIQEDLFKRVQAVMQSRRGVTRPSAGHDYLLRGLARCLDCDSPMIRYAYQWDVGGERVVHPSLLCSRYSRHGKCYRNRVDMEVVESLVLGYLKSILEKHVDPGSIKFVRTETPEHERTIKDLSRRLRSLTERRERIYDSYESGNYSLEIFNARRDKVEADEALLKRQLDSARAQAGSDDPSLIAVQLADRVRTVMATAVDTSQPLAARRAAIESVVHSVLVSKNQDLTIIKLKL